MRIKKMSNWQPIPGGPWETIFRLPPIETVDSEDNDDDIDE
jgi:hypothetical protein